MPAPLRVLPAAVLALIAACSEPSDDAPERAAPEGPRTIVLVSIDTLRPDRLGVYGGPEGNSPRIDAFAADAIVFEQALAPSPWTLPSHMTMLTGLDPVAHGVKRANYLLSTRVHTLAEHLADAGFRTAAFTDGGFVDSQYGFDQGFELYEDDRDPDGPNGFARLLDPALAWMEEHADEDTFVFLHTFDVHAPFDEGDAEVIERFRRRPVEDGPLDHLLHRQRFMLQQNHMGIDEYARLGELLRDYDAGVFEADRGVGRVLDLLERTGRLDDALVIVTSDHGEAMLEHGTHVGHGLMLTDAELAIPLVVKLPGGRLGGTRVEAPVGLVDVAPTVLAAFRLPPGEAMQGEDLRAIAEGGRRRRDWLFGVSQNTGNSMYLVRDGYKYVSPLGLDPKAVAKRHLGPFTPPVLPGMPELSPGKPYERNDGTELIYDFQADPLGVLDGIRPADQLFRRDADPLERRNLAPDQPELVANMRRFCIQIYEQSAAIQADLAEPDQEVPVDPNQDALLRALGYLAGADPEDDRAIPRWMAGEIDAPAPTVDTSALDAADRVVHKVRTLVQRGEPVPEALAGRLQQCLKDYADWFREHPAERDRVFWRVFGVGGLVDVAQRAEAPLRVGRLFEDG